MAPQARVERATNGLTVRYSTTELLGNKTGAGEESRTLDLVLGKHTLYQLSYSRMKIFITANGAP